MKPKTIDQVCGKPESHFAKFVRKQKQNALAQEQYRKNRIKKFRASV